MVHREKKTPMRDHETHWGLLVSSVLHIEPLMETLERGNQLCKTPFSFDCLKIQTAEVL